MMVGRAVSLNIDRPEPVNPKTRIKVENLTVRSQDGVIKLVDVSFTANSGEILGIADISGCGQKELLEAIAGLQPVENGTIKYINDDGQDEELIGRDPLQIAAMGRCAFVCSGRQTWHGSCRQYGPYRQYDAQVFP